MPFNKKVEKEEETLKKKLEDLIRKKSDENTALKKLLEGLNKSDSSGNQNR